MASFSSVANYALNIVKKTEAETTQKEILSTDTPSQAQEKQTFNSQQVKNKAAGIVSSSVGAGIAIASLVYNTNIKFARFGQRGQDISDQNRLQDKVTNMGLTVGGALTGLALSAATGNIFGMAASAIGLIGIGINEAITVSTQNAQYDYNKAIDMEKTMIAQERVGRAIYNSSRR